MPTTPLCILRDESGTRWQGRTAIAGEFREELKMVELSPSFELEYQPIDNDHRRLIGIVNQIVKALDDGRVEECAVLVPDFVNFAKKHFLREEAFLKKVGYPQLQKHYHHHRELNAKMDTMVRLAQTARDSEVARESLGKELVFFLMDDVINADLDFKSYLADKGLIEPR
ncbi:MAG TPA: hemerythrin family protein [Rhodospirillaceae bacterium]|jgi:hemerythrin|nr:hemerythrin family protein [Rhodospirillales bacterium]HIJ42593.1 hemerythrin family protein [Rhodospirillaceae bacterium]HIJ46390.1 hemerythrin family protein [Rhodospirillaceae bacterium]